MRRLTFAILIISHCAMVCVRASAKETAGLPLSPEASALFLAISGHAVPQKDFPDLDPGFLKRLNPPIRSKALVRDPKGRQTPIVYEHRFSRGSEEWRVVGLFNRAGSEAEVRLNLDRIWQENRVTLGKTAGKKSEAAMTRREYLLYDILGKRILGVYQGLAEFRVMPGTAQLICIRAFAGYPRILSIGDHIGQGALELQDANWDERISMLTAKTKGINGASTSVRLYIPPGWKIRSIAINGKSSSWEEYRTEMIRFDAPDGREPATWRATFDGSIYRKPALRPMQAGPIAVLTPLPADDN